MSGGFQRFDFPDVPGAAGVVGVSDEGRTTVSGTFAKDRFLAGFTLGGPPEAMDYRALADRLTKEQAVSLR